MSYDKPNRQRYTHFYDFGAGSSQAISIRGPKGKAGRLHDYGVFGTTEVFNGASVTPKISVGTPSAAAAYGAEIVLQALPADDATSVRMLYNEQDAGFATLMVERDIPKDTEVHMVLTSASGSETGQGTAFVDIDWQD